MSNNSNMRTFNRPEITEEKIQFIRKLIESNPDMGRSRLSVLLCETWDWRDVNGRTKDMSCRDLLLSLDKAGKITLPPRKSLPRTAGDSKPVQWMVHDETPMTARLSDLTPLKVEIASNKRESAQVQSYIAQYHYLGIDRFVGERMAYMANSKDGKPLACLLFGAAAWSCRARDQWIGWNQASRSRNLNLVANNSRFLIYPWIKAPHLASHLLSIIAKRISADWLSRYGHPIFLLETFVETSRFRGICYRAANWIHVGDTTGRGRDGGHKQAILPIKGIYLYPLAKGWRFALAGQERL
jgi:hypothetical protein